MLKNETKQNVITFIEPDSPRWLAKFVNVYQKLSVDNLALLADVYHQDVTFIDPIHEIQGFNDLNDYFNGLYQNLMFCEFRILETFTQGNQAAIYWKMTYQHPKLNRGNPIKVEGHSHLKGVNEYVTYHRDYIDLGAMIYEHVPLLGSLTKWIKTRSSK